MWILESNGDFLQGKRMWLKPGQKYLFGRVKREGVRFAIDHKTVSRKHFIIEVDPVADGDVAHIHARSKIRIQDQNSKSGTLVNNEVIKNATRELKSHENSVRPGNCPHEIIIKWEPCILTFNLLKKEIKAGLLKSKQARVQSYDIKATSDFLIDYTTHVVANKRNTAKGLQALISGKHLVSESYLDALDYVVTPTTLSQEENLSPLELDFDHSWPDPKDHLPPPGREPTIRPVASYQPDSSRLNVFEGYTFIFGDQTQYDNLLPVVTTGHGKALLFKVQAGSTSVEQLLEFIQNAGSQKNRGNQENNDSDKPILVRWTGKEDVQEWTNSLVNETALKMDQRAIDQSEFLDAILANDASLLRQAIPFESTTEGRVAPPSTAVNSLVPNRSLDTRTDRTIAAERSSNGHSDAISRSVSASSGRPAKPQSAPTASSSAQPNVEVSGSALPHLPLSQASGDTSPAPRPYQRSRFTQGSRFKDFDDGFDPDAVAAYDDDDDEDSRPASRSEFEDIDKKGPSSSTAVKEEPPVSNRKRQRSTSEERMNDFAEEIDDLLPAATAFKKRKLAEARAGGRADSIDDIVPPLPRLPRKKKEREIDVRKALDARREEAEQAAKRNEERLHDPIDVNDNGPANLVEVVIMDLPLRDKTNSQRIVSGNHRAGEWDPKWNGRKNFKGFRRKGEPSQRRGHASKVIVPLIAVKRNDFGIGEKYWDKTEEQKEREREKKRQKEARSQRTQSQTQKSNGRTTGRSQSLVQSDEEMEHQIREEHSSRTSPATMRLQREAAAIVEHDIDPDTPRRTRAADKHAATVDLNDDEEISINQQMSQTQADTDTLRSTTTGAKMNGKRAATSSASSSAPKRQKTLPVTVVKDTDSDEDDSDDMKFRFGSRARRGRRGRLAGAGA